MTKVIVQCHETLNARELERKMQQSDAVWAPKWSWKVSNCIKFIESRGNYAIICCFDRSQIPTFTTICDYKGCFGSLQAAKAENQIPHESVERGHSPGTWVDGRREEEVIIWLCLCLYASVLWLSRDCVCCVWLCLCETFCILCGCICVSLCRDCVCVSVPWLRVCLSMSVTMYVSVSLRLCVGDCVYV